MLFNTFHFWIFFFLLSAIFFSIKKSWQPWLLLPASYYFYMCWQPEYALLMLTSTLIAFFSSYGIDAANSSAWKRFYFVVGTLANLGILFFFKYADFFSRNVREALASMNVFVDIQDLNLVLPVGISFFTFQAASYTFDVYRGVTRVERNPFYFALFVSFFPQLVAGPIERSDELLPQMRTPKSFDFARMTRGLRIALWGLFKKVVIADLLSTVVNTVYATPEQFSGPILILATTFFALQIYCDFSGYSDIALGVADVMGYRLMDNFRQPYFATSIGEFWRRWHISLSTWFRDYVYLPLGGNRVSRTRWMLNLLIVFGVSGLWHGAAWTFVIWGLLHGGFLILEGLTADARKRLHQRLGLSSRPWLLRPLQTICVFVLVTIGWVFFRASSVSQALYILSHWWDFSGFQIADLWSLGLPRVEMMLCFAVTAVLAVVDGLLYYQPTLVLTGWRARPARWACYFGMIFGLVFFGVLGKVEFIYFQF
ncbi:MAG: MBOAT family O-acyltransferase [Planctomycetota bacterium]